MKKNRQEALLALIEKEDIGTQEELMHRLCDMGFSVTQATVSRDIKALNLIKTPVADGQYKYTLPQRTSEDIMDKFQSILSHAVLRVDSANNIVCVKCYSGMASAACAAVDEIVDERIVGTLAGDDTFFALCRDEPCAGAFAAELQRLSKAGQ